VALARAADPAQQQVDRGVQPALIGGALVEQ
jgi:hypothetical protein